jgi:hypothetical protein
MHNQDRWIKLEAVALGALLLWCWATYFKGLIFGS